MVKDTLFPEFNLQDLLTSHPSTAQDTRPHLILIAGDASDRKFYRLDDGQRTAICMKFPRWEGGYGGDPLSWLGMQGALAGMGIPVPRILHVDEQNACIWTEDFGDNFLNHALRADMLDVGDPSSAGTFGHYREALDLLVRVQYPLQKNITHPALARAFDHEKLMFEMNFFIKHFVKGWLGLPVSHECPEGARLIADLEALCSWLDGRERVLCHRDYHVRNVMVVEGTAKWIDFQDARMGPHTYDVVSLVRDSYVRMTPKTREQLYKFYFDGISDARAREGKEPWSWVEFQAEALHMGLQRNIKALGSFGYLAIEKHKGGYLKYVPHTLEVIAGAENLVGASVDLNQKYPALTTFLKDMAGGKLRLQVERKLKASGVENPL